MKSGVPTAEAANAIGIARETLQRWIRSGKVKPPKPTLLNGRGVRLWSKADIERSRKIKNRIYGKGRGRKRKRRKETGRAGG